MPFDFGLIPQRPPLSVLGSGERLEPPPVMLSRPRNAEPAAPPPPPLQVLSSPGRSLFRRPLVQKRPLMLRCSRRLPSSCMGLSGLLVGLLSATQLSVAPRPLWDRSPDSMGVCIAASTAAEPPGGWPQPPEMDTRMAGSFGLPPAGGPPQRLTRPSRPRASAAIRGDASGERAASSAFFSSVPASASRTDPSPAAPLPSLPVTRRAAAVAAPGSRSCERGNNSAAGPTPPPALAVLSDHASGVTPGWLTNQPGDDWRASARLGTLSPPLLLLARAPPVTAIMRRLPPLVVAPRAGATNADAIGSLCGPPLPSGKSLPSSPPPPHSRSIISRAVLRGVRCERLVSAAPLKLLRVVGCPWCCCACSSCWSLWDGGRSGSTGTSMSPGGAPASAQLPGDQRGTRAARAGSFTPRPAGRGTYLPSETSTVAPADSGASHSSASFKSSSPSSMSLPPPL
eukprot:360019-Chlamydomonas_euryale.AAC.4